MDSNVVDEFVLCFKWHSISHAFFPTTYEANGCGRHKVNFRDMRYKILDFIKPQPANMIHHFL